MGDQWTTEQTWELIAEFKKTKNFKVLYGPKTGEVLVKSFEVV
jgi:hypothetical protein